MIIYFFYNNCQESFNDISTWYKELKENANLDIKIILVGNKCDLPTKKRVIKKEEVDKIKEEYDIDLSIETSAKTGENIEKLFFEASKMLYKDYVILNKKKDKETKNKPINLDEIGDVDEGKSKNIKCRC